MFIDEIAIHNFMIHRSTELTLRPATVLAGANNAGKSSVFDAILNLSRICSDPINAAFPTGPYSYRSRHHNGAAPDDPIKFRVVFRRSAEATESLAYEIEYRQTSWKDGKAYYAIEHERVVLMPDEDVVFDRAAEVLTDQLGALELDSQTSIFAGIRSAHFERRLDLGDDLLAYVAVNVSRFGKYRLEPNLLNKPGTIPELLSPVAGKLRQPRMRYGGEGLASLLYFLSRTRDPCLDSVVEGVRSAVDGFVGFEFNALPNDFVGFSAVFDDPRGLVEAPNLSTGTLNLIGWLSLLLVGDRQPVLMLEEPELGLTPRSTRAIYQAICAARDNTQVLVSTHSPSLMSWFGSDYGLDDVYLISPAGGEAAVTTYADAVDSATLDFGEATAVNQANQVMHGF